MNALQDISRSDLAGVVEPYLKRQAKEWSNLRRRFYELTDSDQINELDVKIFALIPSIAGAYRDYALGTSNELILREELAAAITRFVGENFPHLKSEKQKQVCQNVLSMYAFTIFLAHGIQPELQRVLRAALAFSERSGLKPEQIFYEDDIYSLFLARTETPETLRKKLETILATSSPKRTAHVFRLAGKILRKEDPVADLSAPSPLSGEMEAKRECACRFLKQTMMWPEVINQRILEVFYPR